MFKIFSIIIKALIFILLIAVIIGYFSGFRYMFVLTGSMKPTLDVNTLVITKPTPLNELKKGDIITFNVNGDKKVNLTHRITMVDYTNKRIYTKGDNNPSPDKNSTKYEFVVGKVILYLPKVGEILLFFKTKAGIIILAGMLAIAFVMDGMNGKKDKV